MWNNKNSIEAVSYTHLVVTVEIESNQKRLRRREKGRKYQTFCKNDMNKKRVIWIELLRVMACIGVIGIHAGSQHFRDMPLDSSVWAVSNLSLIHI